MIVQAASFPCTNAAPSSVGKGGSSNVRTFGSSSSGHPSGSSSGRPSGSGTTTGAALRGGGTSSRSSNVQTVGSTRSRLHDTTEAYRQNRGTTAQNIREVGQNTMTDEKRKQVDKARKVAGAAPLSNGGGTSRKIETGSNRSNVHGLPLGRK